MPATLAETVTVTVIVRDFYCASVTDLDGRKKVTVSVTEKVTLKDIKKLRVTMTVHHDQHNYPRKGM